MKFRRETLIALRARRTAYRIATDIIYRKVEVPKPRYDVPPPRLNPYEGFDEKLTEEDKAKIPPVMPALFMLYVGIIGVVIAAVVALW